MADVSLFASALVGSVFHIAADGQFLADRLPSCKLVTVEGENHVAVPGTEDFDATVTAIAAFLREHAPGPG